MKDIPEKIYIQQFEDPNIDGFQTMGDITWCEETVNKYDIEYVRSDLLNNKEDKSQAYGKLRRIRDMVETQAKWVSKYNIGDTVRHKTGYDKWLIVSVLFRINGSVEYNVTKEDDEKWWQEFECVRVI